MVSAQTIIEAICANDIDIVGLSGLITPSLEEMIKVATLMHDNGLKQPIMIGGATTSEIHTAVKIKQVCDNFVVHVKDASRSVSVANALIKKDAIFAENINQKYDELFAQHQHSNDIIIPIEEARANKLKIDWQNTPPIVQKIGIEYYDDYSLTKLRKLINWNYFFNLWQLKGVYPKILDDVRYGKQARKLFEDANNMLDKIIDNKLITAKGALGIFPANSVGDDIEIYDYQNRSKKLCTFFNLRNQTSQNQNLCISDFVAPYEAGIADYVGVFAVTAGIGIDALVRQYQDANDDYNAIIVKALADRLAEAFAQSIDYGTIRLSHGYPACPDHSEKRTLFNLLNAESIGMSLTETFSMLPAASVSGFILTNPMCKYFSVGKIGKDQEDDYNRRKNSKLWKDH
jgi:5-methyltetrahydrofolate--homocysteine methyltransferase